MKSPRRSQLVAPVREKKTKDTDMHVDVISTICKDNRWIVTESAILCTFGM